MHWGQWAAVGTSAGTGDGQERSPRGSRWRMWPGLSQWSWSGDSGDRSTGGRGGSKGAAWGTATRGSQAGPSPTDVDTRPAWPVSAEEMGSVQTRKRPWPSQAALPTRGLQSTLMHATPASGVPVRACGPPPPTATERPGAGATPVAQSCCCSPYPGDDEDAGPLVMESRRGQQVRPREGLQSPTRPLSQPRPLALDPAPWTSRSRCI